jgi:hypothetical protein
VEIPAACHDVGTCHNDGRHYKPHRGFSCFLSVFLYDVSASADEEK